MIPGFRIVSGAETNPHFLLRARKNALEKRGPVLDQRTPIVVNLEYLLRVQWPLLG